MIEIEINRTQLLIEIPIKNIDELTRYQEGIMGLLRRIEVGDCDPELKENIKIIYGLLMQLHLNERLIKSEIKK
jgi:hypothetical protein